jgi:hypothetical protein
VRTDLREDGYRLDRGLHAARTVLENLLDEKLLREVDDVF